MTASASRTDSSRHSPTPASSPMSLLHVAILAVLAFVIAGAVKRWSVSVSANAAATTVSSSKAGSGTPMPAPDAKQSTPHRQSRQDDDLFGLGLEIIHAGTEVVAEIADETVGLTTAEEQLIGREAHAQIRRSHNVQDSSPQVARIKQLAQPFLAARKQKELDYQFFVIDDAALNAFAHLGGYVYVHTGLLKAARSDDELKFVIGHEIAHCELRHSVKNMTIPLRAGELVGEELVSALAAKAWQLVALGYSEDYEFASDEWSYRQMRGQNVSHDRSMLGLLMLEQATGAQRRAVSKPEGPKLLKHLSDHFRSHPEIADRIARLNRLRDIRTF